MDRRDAMRRLQRSAYYLQDGDPTPEWGLERKLVANFRLAMLVECGGNRTRAAIELGVSVRALRGFLARMRKRGLDIPQTHAFDPGPLPSKARQVFEDWAALRDPVQDFQLVP